MYEWVEEEFRGIYIYEVLCFWWILGDFFRLFYSVLLFDLFIFINIYCGIFFEC